jgi:hypothetical protein
MLWSLLVSGYIIYLYRKLNAENEAKTASGESAGGGMSALDAELATLNERIATLESQVSAAATRERAS